jgi:hypothetical protein
MFSNLNEIEAALKRRGEQEGVKYLDDLKKICAAWTIQARYSTQTIQLADAEQLVDRVRR